MLDYYKTIDENEDKRVADNAKNRHAELKERNLNKEQAQTVCEALGIDMMPFQDLKKDATEEDIKAHEALEAKLFKEWDVKVVKQFEAIIRREIQKKRSERLSQHIVPDAPVPLNITDKEGNSVHRVIIYKPQSEDVMKALKKKNYTPRLFTYDKEAWEKEN